ncbi:MAG: ABC-F type ribosomal protection protein [Bacillota bacterium]
MLVSLKNVVKYVQDRCLFKIESLRVCEGDRIGIVGRNGAGKSTLLGMLAGTIQPDAGDVRRCRPCSYIAQFDAVNRAAQAGSVAGKHFAAKEEYHEFMSGGEKIRYRLAAAFSEESPLLLADEPTASLDVSGVVQLQAQLQNYRGAFVLVSHDRQLLDEVCNVIWEINAGRLQVYPGNYSNFLTQREIEEKQRAREYEKYISAKKQLELAVIDRQARSASTRKTPKRMGNSEARLHKMGNQKAKANLDKAVQGLESRLAQLAVKEKPKAVPTVDFNLGKAEGLYSKAVIRGEGINKSFGRHMLFNNVDFTILRGHKVALLGDNGCGKTTFLKMILGREDGIFVSPAARIGYFAQGMDDLKHDRSILHNIMAVSVHEEGFVRQLLARLLFRRDDVHKPVGVLSGGERGRVALAKIMVSEANVLLLDEPTNFLDLPSLEALEHVLAEYNGTILFASHDRRFMNKLATQLMVFTRAGIETFTGNCEQYLQAGQGEKAPKNKLPQEEQLLREYRLSEVLSRISTARDKDELARLDTEYRRLLTQGK